jgi:hypothetical protein
MIAALRNEVSDRNVAALSGNRTNCGARAERHEQAAGDWQDCRGEGRLLELARHLELLRRLLAAIFNNFVFDHLPFIEGTQARTFNRRDMNEDVLASAAVRLKRSARCLFKTTFASSSPPTPAMQCGL